MKVIWLDREAARRQVQTSVHEMARRRPEILRVLLFGSLATGQAVPGSDADLLILLKSCDQPFPQRISDYIPDDCGIGVDVFPYTEAEIESMKASGNWFIRRALAEGVEIYPAALE